MSSPDMPPVTGDGQVRDDAEGAMLADLERRYVPNGQFTPSTRVIVLTAYRLGWAAGQRDALQTARRPAGPIKRGREYEHGPYHYFGDGCHDHV